MTRSMQAWGECCNFCPSEGILPGSCLSQGTAMSTDSPRASRCADRSPAAVSHLDLAAMAPGRSVCAGGLARSLLDGRGAHELIKEDRWTTQRPSGHRDAQRYIQCLFGNTDGCRCHAFGSGLPGGWGLVSKRSPEDRQSCMFEHSNPNKWSYFYTTAIKTQHEQSEGF